VALWHYKRDSDVAQFLFSSLSHRHSSSLSLPEPPTSPFPRLARAHRGTTAPAIVSSDLTLHEVHRGPARLAGGFVLLPGRPFFFSPEHPRRRRPLPSRRLSTPPHRRPRPGIGSPPSALRRGGVAHRSWGWGRRRRGSPEPRGKTSPVFPFFLPMTAGPSLVFFYLNFLISAEIWCKLEIQLLAHLGSEKCETNFVRLPFTCRIFRGIKL
jgi:hypothetical protein